MEFEECNSSQQRVAPSSITDFALSDVHAQSHDFLELCADLIA